MLTRFALLFLAIAAVTTMAVSSVEAHGPIPAPTPPAFPPMFPMPTNFSNGSTVAFLSTLTLYQTGPKSDDLANAFTRFIERTFPHKVNAPCQSPLLCIDTVEIHVKNATTPLQLYVDESYFLSVTATHVIIQAKTVYGAYHALETLSQLIFFNFDTQLYNIKHCPWSIADAPRFPHRGLLVDTARHFLPVKTITDIIESITYAKLNTIHWHMVDAESFAFDSPSYPRLGKYSAFSSQERFTPNDVAYVVEFARQRGVRVMIELDTPGHSAAMCKAYPEICPNPLCPSKNVNNWALDPTQNMTYSIVRGVLQDLVKLFPELMTHLGGDEVDTYCWEHRPAIMKWLSDRGLTAMGGFEYYFKRIQAMAWGMGREVVGWQEIWEHFGTALNKMTIIHQWLPNSTALPRNVTSHGYRLIWSDSSVWYLDHLKVTWEQMYNAEPCKDLTGGECSLILGGEACQFGETVDTSDALQTIWPRTAAVAERLWSPRDSAVLSNVTHSRIAGFRCLMNRRGVAAAPVDNLVARSAPPHPGSCYEQ